MDVTDRSGAFTVQLADARLIGGTWWVRRWIAGQFEKMVRVIHAAGDGAPAAAPAENAAHRGGHDGRDPLEPEAEARRQRVLAQVAALDAIFAAVGAAQGQLEAAAQDHHRLAGDDVRIQDLEIVAIAQLFAPAAAAVAQPGIGAGVAEVAPERSVVRGRSAR